MDEAFLTCWFKGFEDGLEAMDTETRSRLLAHCARRCADTGVLQTHLHHYEVVGGDRDAFYRRLSEIGGVRGEVIVPGREYAICFPDCACDLHTDCGVSTPLLCECSRQSVRYVAETVWKGYRVRVIPEGTVLSGAVKCRFRLIFDQTRQDHNE